MEKNTTLVSLSKSNLLFEPSRVEVNNEQGPSEQTLLNILNYSKALKVEERKDSDGFIEYITN